MASQLPAADSLTCWGTTIKAALAFVEERQADARRAVIARTGARSREVLGGTVLPSAHYPLRVLVELCEAIDAELGRGDLTLCREIGGHAAGYEVNLLHRVFLTIASLDFWFRMAGSMWRTYYSAGDFRAEFKGTDGGRVTLAAFNPISKAFCARLGGWMERICEMSKYQQISISHTTCLLDGASACTWEGTWVPK